MIFLRIYLGEGKGAFTTEQLDGCLGNLVGMNNSWTRTCVKAFQLDPPRGGSRAGQK